MDEKKQQRNVALLLFLSDYKDTKKSYEYRFVTGERYEGIQTNDAPVECLLKMALTKMTGSKTPESGAKFNLQQDKKLYIFCITSYKVMTKYKGETGEEIIAWVNFQETLKKLQERYVEIGQEGKRDLFEFISIPYDYREDGNGYKQFTEEDEDTSQMAQRIFGEISGRLEDNDIKDVYVDYTGGMRDINFLMTTIIRYLEFKGINCQKVVYSQYDKDNSENNRIRDITYIYEMFQMINGVNEFITTGHATALNEIFKLEREKAGGGEEAEEHKEVKKLLENMVKFSNAMSICDVSNIDKYLRNIRDSINELESDVEKTDTEDKKNSGAPDLKVAMLKQLLPIMREKMYLQDLGQKDYYIKLIKWCAENNMLQQALTLIEDKMPDIYIGENGSSTCADKVLLYDFTGTNDEDRKAYLKAVGPKHERNERRKIFYYTNMDWNTNWKYSDSNLTNLKTMEAAEISKIIVEWKSEEAGQNSGSAQKNETIMEKKAKECCAEDEQKFIGAYCKFRRLEDISSRNDGRQHKSDYGSILKWCLGKGEQVFSVRTEQDEISVKLRITMHKKIEKSPEQEKYLETTLLLHSALKKERNCCNHASDNGVRLPAGVVKRAIEIYVKRVEKVLEYISA